MWDVNPSVRLDYKHRHKFDLNYVGCEPVMSIVFQGTSETFDLNYVGCEQNDVLRSRNRSPRFDLNYVGCELMGLIVNGVDLKSLI